MSGVAYVLPVAATDLTLPKLRDHPEMSDGSILLLDFNHEFGEFTGVPGTGAVLKNVASRNMKQIYGLADSIDDLNMTFEFGSDANGMLVERTTKKGLHILPSQLNQITNNNKGIIRPSSRLRQEIFNRVPQTEPDGGFYVSAWYKATRGQVAGFITSSRMHLAQNISGSSNMAWHTQASPVAGDNLLGTQGPTNHGNGNGTILGFGSGTWRGTKPSFGNTLMSLFGVGQIDAWSNSTNRNKAAGIVLYRLKIEDLKFTKRANGGVGGTPAEEYALAAAADLAAFTAAFNAGGSLYGDGWSDVTLFP